MTTDNLTNSQVLKLKGRLFTITVIQLLDNDLSAFKLQIEKIVNQAPKLFYRTPVVLDLSSIEQEISTLNPFFNHMHKLKLCPLGIQGTQAWVAELASAHSLPVFQSSASQDRVLESVKKTVTKVVTQPVRSGQQLVSKGADLIVASSVSHGAELLSDCNIHVYGPLRGRALAGIDGDKSARIFCTQLDAELVSIAGFYRLRESITPISGPCQIFIQDDRLQIAPL